MTPIAEMNEEEEFKGYVKILMTGDGGIGVILGDESDQDQRYDDKAGTSCIKACKQMANRPGSSLGFPETQE